ncbi:hypothetical protein niasHS_013126 [Heterodera schachtii]|uniref:Uncharacterized protein n=1 Tax=Heterodera schachtii TaxID=97005 RepID=A0ABD2IAA1_HETSC
MSNKKGGETLSSSAKGTIRMASNFVLATRAGAGEDIERGGDFGTSKSAKHWRTTFRRQAKDEVIANIGKPNELDGGSGGEKKGGKEKEKKEGKRKMEKKRKRGKRGGRPKRKRKS